MTDTDETIANVMFNARSRLRTAEIAVNDMAATTNAERRQAQV
jgi:hypothetical protein